VPPQWNINCLFGADPQPDHAVDAEAIMRAITPLNPDLIFFQEACVLSYGPPSSEKKNWWDELPPSTPRIEELHELLESEGYRIVQADGCQNPAMIATRLPVSSMEPSFVIDADPFRSRMEAKQVIAYRISVA
jgi:endonuclease/exonuclease/phosphatase family metal-dependent hydrolase